MTFMVSQWVTATNDPYHVVAYTGTLPAKGRKTEGEKVAFTENGWPGLPATEDMLNWIVVPGTIVGTQNYCQVSITGPKDARAVQIRCYDKTNALQWEQSIPASALE